MSSLYVTLIQEDRLVFFKTCICPYSNDYGWKLPLCSVLSLVHIARSELILFSLVQSVLFRSGTVRSMWTLQLVCTSVFRTELTLNSTWRSKKLWQQHVVGQLPFIFVSPFTHFLRHEETLNFLHYVENVLKHHGNKHEHRLQFDTIVTMRSKNFDERPDRMSRHYWWLNDPFCCRYWRWNDPFCCVNCSWCRYWFFAAV